MTVTIVRPIAYNNSQAGTATGAPSPDNLWKDWVVDPSGSLVTNVNDNSDSTKIKEGVNTSAESTFTVGGWKFPAVTVSVGQYINNITYNVRYDVVYVSNGEGLVLNTHVTRNGYDGQHNGLLAINHFCTPAKVGLTDAIRTLRGPLVQTNLDTGAKWTAAELVNDYSLFVSTAHYGAGALTIRIYDVWLEVSTNTPPTVTSTPNTAVTTTTSPTLLISYNDPDGDLPDREEIKIFSQAQYSAVGFNPLTSPNVFQKISPRNSTSPIFTYPVATTGLQNGGTYKTYARLRQQSDGVWSDWGISTFNIALDAPLAPTLTGTALDSLAGVKLAVASNDNLLTAQQSSLEAGTTTGWASGASTTISFSAAQFLDGIGSLQIIRLSTTGTASATISTGVRAAVAPSTQYTGIASLRANTTARSASIQIVWYDSSGAIISTSTGSSVTDSNSAWTQYTVVANSPANAASALLVINIASAAANESHFADRIGIMPGNTSTWGLGGYSDPSYIAIEASSDGGVTWNIIRGGTLTAWQDLLANTSEVTWYEAPPGVSTSYRAAVIGLLSGNAVQSPYSSIVNITSMPAGNPYWWIIDPLDPSNNMQVDMSGNSWKYNKNESQGVFRVMGAENPIVVSDVVQSKSGSLPCYFESRILYDLFSAMRDNQHTVLIKRVYAAAMDQFYVRFGSNLSVEEFNTTPISIQADIEFTEVVAP